MYSNYLVDFMKSRKNNLDIIRFFAAILVAFSHSYPLVQASNDNEPLFVFTKQTTFGGIAVAIFFIISGFLIPQSFDKSNNLKTYIKSRILRIFPGLFAALAVSAFIIGPLLTSLPISEYFSNPKVYKYFIGITLLPNLSPSLPGVFEANTFGSFVNGSLWTLKFEFLFYIVVALIGVFKLLNKKFVLFYFIVTLLLSLPNINSNLHNLFMLGSYFSAGTLLYLFRHQIKLKRSYVIISLILVLFASKIGLFEASIALFGSYLVIYIGYQQKFVFSSFTKYGDISYGIYIYAFPIQQSIIAIFSSNITPFQNFIISLPIIIICSFLSWHLIKKRALKLKHVTLIKSNEYSTP